MPIARSETQTRYSEIMSTAFAGKASQEASDDVLRYSPAGLSNLVCFLDSNRFDADICQQTSRFGEKPRRFRIAFAHRLTGERVKIEFAHTPNEQTSWHTSCRQQRAQHQLIAIPDEAPAPVSAIIESRHCMALIKCEDATTENSTGEDWLIVLATLSGDEVTINYYAP